MVTTSLDLLYFTNIFNDRRLYRTYVGYIPLVSEHLNKVAQLQPHTLIFMKAETKEQAMARFRQSVFASISLTTQDKSRFRDWAESNNAGGLQILNNMAADGFKFSCSWVDSQDAFCFSLVGTDNTKLHQGMVMTSWSSDLEEVIMISAYKHYVLCDGGEWPSQQAGERWG